MTQWTEPKVNRLRALAAEHLSTREIAQALQTTRNAVIGKCFREDIPLRYWRSTSPDRSISPEAA